MNPALTGSAARAVRISGSAESPAAAPIALTNDLLLDMQISWWVGTFTPCFGILSWFGRKGARWTNRRAHASGRYGWPSDTGELRGILARSREMITSTTMVAI